MRHFRTRHVGASHDGNQHVQQMHDHHEGRNNENEDQCEGGPLISQEEAVVVEFSKSQKPHVPEWSHHGIVSYLHVLVLRERNIVEVDLVLAH